MSVFYVGAEVVEIKTGDVGTITREAWGDDHSPHEGAWWVKWADSGDELWLEEDDMRVLNNSVPQNYNLPDTITIDGVKYRRVV